MAGRNGTRPDGARGAGGRRARAWEPVLPGVLALAVLGACGGDDSTRYPTGPAAPAAPAVGQVQPSDRPAQAADEPPESLAPIAAAPIGIAGEPVQGAPVQPDPVPVTPPVGTPSGLQPDALGQFLNDPTRLEPLPEPAAVEITDSGLQVVYTTDAQRGAIEPSWVEAQWQHMQSCTGIVAPPPLVLIVEGRARPITPRDDVVAAIDGSALATASVGTAGSTLQVSDADLLPGAPDRGFALRAITGRWLWQGDERALRDYPFECAVDGPASG